MSDTPLTDALIEHRADLRGPDADPEEPLDEDDAAAFIAWAKLLERDRARLAEALRKLHDAYGLGSKQKAAALVNARAALASLEE